MHVRPFFTQNIFTRTWVHTTEWTPTWLVLFLTGVGWMVLGLARRKPSIIAIASLVTLILFNSIPFWTRYLVLILPFLYLVSVSLLTKLPKSFFILTILALMLMNGWRTQAILFPTPEKVVAQVLYDWQYGLFQDMYEHTTDEVKATIPRNDFHRFGQTIYHDGQIEAVMIKPEPVIWSSWQPRQSVPLTITYVTRNLGTFQQTTTLPVIRTGGDWRIPWQWNFLIDGINATATLETDVTLAKRGMMTDKKKAAPVARDMDSWLVWVTPNDIDKSREETMLQFLQGLFDKRAAAALLHLRYSQQQPDMAIALGVTRIPLEDDARRELLSYPGITLTPAFSRWVEGTVVDYVGLVANTQYPECCSHLYNTTAYDGTSGWEKDFNEALKGQNGGSLVIKDAQGNVVRTILSVEKQDGRDVEL